MQKGTQMLLLFIYLLFVCSTHHQSSSDDSYSEEEYSGDRFVAQLYKFQDERGLLMRKQKETFSLFQALQLTKHQY